jgi:catechol 2,3-dioxygenase-like lactoylglutathione lyase family enzyme
VSATNTGTRITDIRTVGVPVNDQEKALAFYSGTLGFEKRLDVPFGDGNRWIEVAPPGAATTIALLPAAGHTAIGIDTHIRLTTGDAAADHADLKSKGVDVDADVIPYPMPMFSFRDPDGNTLYLVQRMPGQP